MISGVSKNSSNFQNQSKRWNYTAVLKYVSFNLFLFKFGQISHLHFECNKANLFVLFAVFLNFIFIFFGGRLLQSTEPVIVSGSRTTCYREQWTVPLWMNSERRSWHTVYATVPPPLSSFNLTCTVYTWSQCFIEIKPKCDDTPKSPELYRKKSNAIQIHGFLFHVRRLRWPIAIRFCPSLCIVR